MAPHPDPGAHVPPGARLPSDQRLVDDATVRAITPPELGVL